MYRTFLRISLLACFAAACLTSGMPRATVSIFAALIPASTTTTPAEEEESHSSCKEATAVGERQRQERRVGRYLGFVAYPQSRLTAIAPVRGKPAGHRLHNGLLAPMLT